ncbi:MAG TPA: hypothetical protein PKK23_01925 [Nitrospirales bacterium]|nr:hypothetical protein [Nitrospiraceae bacterium]HNP27773.1 hypothetical protein [Nitrospirales bacterium]
MYTRSKMAKSFILAGIPLLTFPLLAESGMSRDGSDRMDSSRANAMERIIQGEVSKKNGDQITLRASNGERITFRINDETNQLCPKGMASQTSQSQASPMDKGSSSGQGTSMNQGSSSQHSSSQSPSDQGTGETSSSSLFGSQSSQFSGQNSSGMQANSQQSQNMGFKFGECNFQNGEFVKAKVDENGNATFVRSMGDSEEYYGTGGVGGEYFVLPAGQLGGLDISDKDAHYSVKTSDDQEVGNVYKVMTNNDGDLTYAIVRKKDGQLFSVPWQALEGAGNKSFRLKVTQNQLSNLPVLNEGEGAGAHVQKHWDLTQQERKELAKWNERLDDFYETRDRYYEDTPTFEGNREGYDRYDQRRSRMSRSEDDRQRHYQDQNAENYQTKRNSFSPSEFPPHDRAFQYEGADQRRSYDRQRSYQDQNAEDFQTKRNRFSPTEFPPHDRAFQYEGADRQHSYDRNRPGRSSDDFRNRGDQRSMYSQSRERQYDNRDNRSSRYESTTRPSKYDPQREGADRYQARRSGNGYDYRPDEYRP